MTRLLSTNDLPDGHPAWEFMTGVTPFLASRADQRFAYSMYIPSGYRSRAHPLPLLVAVHGTGRRVEATRDALISFAERHGVAVLAPLFAGGIDDPNDLHNYKFIDYAGIRFDRVLLGMVEEAAERWDLDADRFLLAGFSGGGQFAHRFAYLHPERLRGVSAGAPGRVTLLDDEPWPWGVADAAGKFGRPLDLEALRAVPIQVVVGGDDLAAELLSAAADDEREHRAGATRLERSRELVASLGRGGVAAELAIVPGVGHDSAGVLPAVEEFLSRCLAAE